MFDDLTPLIDFEYTQIHYNQSPPSDELDQGIVQRVGSVPVLFSAPHACRHKRAGQWKQEDEYTATIAEWLHRSLDTHAIYINHQIDPDPHDDDAQNIYKQALATFTAQHPLALIIDLHGVRGDREFGIALGTMNNLTCPRYQPVIIQQFENCGFKPNGVRRLDTLAINHPLYTGGLTRPTITRFAFYQLHIPAIQVEINAWLRILKRTPQSSNALDNNAPNFQCDHQRFRRLMDAFHLVTNQIKQMM
jgi:hypothetical protein